jgi:hypothetical protein
MPVKTLTTMRRMPENGREARISFERRVARRNPAKMGGCMLAMP